MALNIKDPAAERLIAEVAELADESKIQALRTALEERRERLQMAARRRTRAQRLTRFLENEAWPQIPDTVRGEAISKAERESILGYGPDGV